MKVLLTGATGLIGHELGLELVRRGHEVCVVSRRKEAAQDVPYPCRVLQGDLSKGPLPSGMLTDIEGVIHLMGESVASGRWTAERRRRILDSRVLSTRHLIQSLESAPLKVFVSASAVGYYGDRGDETLTEDSKPGSDFLSEVCQAWEREVFSLKDRGPQVRVAAVRLGIVLSAFGGALTKMLTPFRLGLGGPFGRGDQWMSWIHLRDAVGIFTRVLEDASLDGVMNGVAPEPVTNREFSRELGACFGKGLAPAVPSAALKLGFGEMSEALLGSQRVMPTVMQKAGYRFEYPNLKSALAEATSLYADGDMILRSQQYFDVPPEKIFPFFAEAQNLERITPPLLGFHIEKMSTPEIEEGSLIDYRLKIHGVPVKWRTRIEEWVPGKRFVDTQLKGPYKKWHHTHSFEKLGRGTLMTDLVRYRVPLGWAGWFASGWMVEKDVNQIFDYRRQYCARHFSEKNQG